MCFHNPTTNEILSLTLFSGARWTEGHSCRILVCGSLYSWLRLPSGVRITLSSSKVSNLGSLSLNQEIMPHIRMISTWSSIKLATHILWSVVGPHLCLVKIREASWYVACKNSGASSLPSLGSGPF